MEIKNFNKIPKVEINVYALQKMYDYLRLSQSRVAFGCIFYEDKSGDIFVDDVYVFEQKSGLYTITIDQKYLNDEIEDREENTSKDEERFSGMGICYQQNKTEAMSGGDKNFAKDYIESIGKIYGTFLAISVFKNKTVIVSIIDQNTDIFYYDIPYTINYDVVGESDATIKKELDAVKSASYYNGYKDSYSSSLDKYNDKWYDKGSSYVKSVQPYKDAKINEVNPDFKSLV